MIPVSEPLLDGNEEMYLRKCIQTGWISSEGPFVKQFEQQFSERTGRRHGIAVCNGTAALDVAIEALQIGKGDEVIMPAFTIISCIGQLVRTGAVPVLVDSDPVSWNMDVSQIAARITSRTRAIMVVHTYGLPVDMNPVLVLAEKHGLSIIEDAAQAHGQTYRGRPCGSFGKVSTFSFYSNKHVTTGEGGMIVTDSDQISEDCRSLRNLCFRPESRFVHDRLGWNYRMSNIQAALGVAQLERLDEFTDRKRRMGKRYRALLSGIEGVRQPLPATDYAENNFWVYGLVLDSSLEVKAADLINRLGDLGIGCRPFFCPMHQQPILQRLGYFAGQEYPVAESLYQYGFYIPSGIALSDEQMERVAEGLHEVLL